MSKKIIFLDIDGTLCQPGNNKPPLSALNAIKETQEKGNLVYLCTGRNLGMISPLLDYGFDGLIASSGGYIVCGNREIYDCPIGVDQQKNVMDILEKNGIFRTIECRDRSYVDEGFKAFLKEKSRQESNSEILRWREQIEKDLGILPMSCYQGEPIYKMVLMFESLSQLDQPLDLFNETFSFTVQDDGLLGYINGEMVPRFYDKGKGVIRVCEYLGIPIINTFGYGDSMNDKEMIETVNHGVVMRNGSPNLKLIADEICDSLEEDGIYKSFQKNNLL